MKTVRPLAKRPNSVAAPAYQRIEEDLRERIRTGEMAAGTMLPGRKDLAAAYGVALSTVERAVSGLLHDGTLRADRRRGTFVASQIAAPGAARTPAAPRDPAAEPLTATLGIIDVVSLYTHRFGDDAYGWTLTIASALERVFSASAGATRSFTRFRAGASPMPVAEAVGGLVAEGVEAVALIGVYQDAPEFREMLHALDTERVPTVLISTEAMTASLPHVFYDNRAAGAQAAQHLIRAGCRDLIVCAPTRFAWAEERIAGAQEAVAQADRPGVTLRVLPPSEGPLPPGGYEEAGLAAGRAALQSRAGLPPMPGVIAVNDTTAFGWMQAMREAGLTAGPDYGLVGFDDDPRARALGLTTLRPPLEALGEQAARVALDMLRGDRSGFQVRLRSHLIPRASTDRHHAARR